jgi:hypothetical protein
MEIVFTNTFGVDEKYYPEPASTLVPQWYKELESYVGGEKKPTGDGQTMPTIKRCMPVFDAITSGYIISTYVDVWVTQKDVIEESLTTGEKNKVGTSSWYEWPSFDPLGFHPIEQAPNYPNNTGDKRSYPKWISPWSIKTPPGYSTLITPPMHRESIFTILSGVVDSDEYYVPVNFPFVLNNEKFEGLIPAGTPIAQVIPFKRDSWKMTIGSEKDLIDQEKRRNLLRTKFFDSYKTQFRQTKEYK